MLADDKIITGKFVVSFYAEGDQKLWVVNALEHNIYNDLSGYARVVPFKKVKDDAKLCKNHDIDCVLDIYKALNIDALMLGVVDDSDIEYEVYDVQNRFLVKTGSIDIGGGSSLLELRMGAFKAFKPFLEKGGILEKRKYEVTAGTDQTSEFSDAVQSKAPRKINYLLLVALAGFTCFPCLLSLIGKPFGHPERSRIVFRTSYPFLIISLLATGYLVMAEASVVRNIFEIILNPDNGFLWMLSGVGGILWGIFLIVNFKIVVPHLQGIERIKPNNLFPLLLSCLVTLLLKTLIFSALYSVFFYAVMLIGAMYAVNQEVIVLLLFPLSGLYILCWFAMVLDVFSMSIDVKLTGKKPDFNNVWNKKIREYFISYLKRNGVTLSKRLVDDIVFLPGENKGIVCYGGGFSRPRITIEKELIKFALGDVDEFNPEKTGIYARKVFRPTIKQSSVFKIIPNLALQEESQEKVLSLNDKKKLKNINSIQKYYQHDMTFDGRKLNDRTENVMQGTILPQPGGRDDIASLMADSLDDMKVVEQLLIENSIFSAHYDEDAEIDFSHEENKDFLFGAILHEFGGLLRHDDIFSTIYLYFRYKKGMKRKTYNYLFSKYFAVVSDTFTVLNFGLNHLMQHLHYQATNNPRHLTTKGITSRMLKSQDKILTGVKQLVDVRKTNFVQTDELDRIIWLSRFCQDSIEEKAEKSTGPQRVIKWSFSIGVIYLASLVFINSWNYHPVYLDIIEKEKQEIADAIKDEQEKVRKAK